MTDIQRFVGVWELDGVEDSSGREGEGAAVAPSGAAASAPAAGFERPVGLLIYLASGVMSVNFAGTSRIPFLREFSPSPSELAAAGAAYGGYAGRWELDEPCHEVLHHVEAAFVPNRVGRSVRRSYSFKEESLLLVLRPIALAPGDEAPNRVLKWRRRGPAVL
ncbi:MAG: lipocalin-like domain-containing protein [Acidobacteriota bacterium]